MFSLISLLPFISNHILSSSFLTLTSLLPHTLLPLSFRPVLPIDDKVSDSKDTVTDIEKEKMLEKEREKIKEREKEYTVNFAELGRKFELTPGSIQAAIARACAEVRACTVLTVVAF